MHEDLCTLMLICSLILFKINISDKSCRESQNTHLIHDKFFFWKSCYLWDNVEKYGRDRQATDDSIVQHIKDVICMPDN